MKTRVLRDRTLGNIAVSAKEFGDKNRALGGPHLGVVGYQNVLNAVFQNVVLPDSPNHCSHAIFSITVKPRLRSKRVFVDYYHMFGG